MCAGKFEQRLLIINTPTISGPYPPGRPHTSCDPLGVTLRSYILSSFGFLGKPTLAADGRSAPGIGIPRYHSDAAMVTGLHGPIGTALASPAAAPLWYSTSGARQMHQDCVGIFCEQMPCPNALASDGSRKGRRLAPSAHPETLSSNVDKILGRTRCGAVA